RCSPRAASSPSRTRRCRAIRTTCWSKPGFCPARAWRCALSAATASSRRPGISSPGTPSRRRIPIRSASTCGVTSVPAAPPPAVYRSVVLLLWALAVNATIACRGLFWDGSPFMANILDLGQVHDFYTARAHVDWVTQLPLLLLSELGVRHARLLATVYSAALFGLPTALSHLALARVKHDAVLLGIVIVVIAAVYL